VVDRLHEEPGLAGHLVDPVGVLAHFVPGRRRAVGIEPGRLKKCTVVDEALREERARQTVDLAVLVAQRFERLRAELVVVLPVGELIADRHDLAASDEALRLGERNLDDVFDRLAGELRREGQAVPHVGRRLDRDVRVLLLEGFDPGVERRDACRVGRDGIPLDRDRDGGILIDRGFGGTAAARARREQADDRQRSERGEGDPFHLLLLRNEL
jgi:hypothetical protein